MPRLSSTLQRFTPSAINEIFTLAVRLREEGRELVDLSIGEADFDTPRHVCEAAHRAIEAGDTRYTSISGTTALKQAVRRKFRRDNDLEFAPEEIVVTSGSKPLLFYAFQAMVEAGDEVVLPAPCWASFPGMVRLAGATPVFARAARGGLEMEAEDLAAAITPRTRCVLLNSPCNPSGVVLREAKLAALAEVLLAHPDVWVISDDLYEHLVYDDVPFATIARVEPCLAERCLTVNGLSKTYAMTGWRVGFGAGPTALIAAIVKIMSQCISNACSVSQAAAVAALEGPQELLAERRAVLAGRRDLALERLTRAPGLECSRPGGAFFLYPGCGELLGRRAPDGTVIESSTDLARYLLDRCGVAVIPGAAFEADPHLRVSFAVAENRLAEGCERIADACAALR